MKKKTLGIIIVSVLGTAAIFCSAMFTHQYLDAKNSKSAFDDLTTKSMMLCLSRTTTLSVGSRLRVRMSITPSCKPRTSRTSI